MKKISCTIYITLVFLSIVVLIVVGNTTQSNSSPNITQTVDARIVEMNGTLNAQPYNDPTRWAILEDMATDIAKYKESMK